MARQNKKAKHGKKRTRINKRKLIIVTVGLLIVAFGLFKIFQTVFSGISVAK